MVTLRHDADKGWFGVLECGTYIGYLWWRIDNKWVFEASWGTISDCTLSDIKAILRTLNS